MFSPGQLLIRAFLIRKAILLSAAIVIFGTYAFAQVDDVCREFGETPTREVNRVGRAVAFVYGFVTLKGVAQDTKPRVTLIYSDSQQPTVRQPLGKGGNYCFKKLGNGATIIVDVDGVEMMRKSISDLGGVRQREDFEVFPPQISHTASPGILSTKFSRPPNEKTAEIYKAVALAEREHHHDKAIELVKSIVEIDQEDFIAWAKLGSLLLDNRLVADAETAFYRSLLIRPDYVPALLNIGIIRALEKKYQAAIDSFKIAVASDPTSARGYRLLGEAYLQNRQGTLGLAALDKSLVLDPVGMAECHLLKARLYDLAGAKALAAAEYKSFLSKVPEYQDRKKLEDYIKENSK